MDVRTLLFALLFMVACSDTFERTYRTRTEAEYDGAIAAGWVPSWIPQDAMQIREAHTADSVIVRFSYPKERELKLPSPCARIAGSTAPAPPFKRAWWPESVPERERTVERYSYHKCDE